MSADTTTDAILELRGVTKHFDGTVALDGIDLDVCRGEFLTLLGPSGSGKTTTLNLIAGFDEPTEGEMLMNGKPLGKLPPQKRGLGVVFQHYALFPHLSVAQNIEYPLRQRGLSRQDRRSRVAEALEMVRLEGVADRRPRELSGGQQQRVAVARALVYRPPILLMDEPLGALDKSLREWLQTELRRIHREVGSTFIYVTHDQEEALALSDRIAVFNEGRIEQIGTPQELYSTPRSLFVGQFIGDSSVFPGREGGMVLVRPERIEVISGPGPESAPGLDNRLDGVIQDLVYLGAQIKVTVATEVGPAIAQLPEERAAGLAVGAHATVAWADRDAVHFAQ